MSEMVDRVAMRLSAEMPNGSTTRDMRDIARIAMEAMRRYTFDMEQACMKAMADGEPFELVWERAFNIALRPD